MKKFLILFVFLFVFGSVPMVGHAQTNSTATNTLIQTLLKRIGALEKMLADMAKEQKRETQEEPDEELWAEFEKGEDVITVTTDKKQELLVRVQKYSKSAGQVIYLLKEKLLQSNSRGKIMVKVGTSMACGEYIQIRVKDPDSDFIAKRMFESSSCSTPKVQAQPKPTCNSGYYWEPEGGKCIKGTHGRIQP